MAFKVSKYLDPGVYISEVIEPGSVSITSERVMAIVAKGSRSKRANNEAVIRGKVYEEELDSWSSSSPYRHLLVNVSDRNKNNAVLYMNGNALGVADWEFVSAELVGTAIAGAAVDTATGSNTKFTLSVDKLDPITIDIPSGAAVDVGPASAVGTVAKAINDALVASSIYGSVYANVASTITGTVADDTLVLTSPLGTPSSDVKVWFSYEDDADTYNDAANLISGGSWNPAKSAGVQAPTYIQLLDALYQTTSAYEIEYVTVQTTEDPLTEADTDTPLESFEKIGSFPDVSTYTENSDFENSGSNTVKWGTSLSSQAEVTSIDGPFTITSTSDTLLMSINDKTQVTVTLTVAAMTPAEVVEKINLAFGSHADYGPRYAWITEVSGSGIKLTAPKAFELDDVEIGENSTINFFDVSNNAFDVLFGTGTSLPWLNKGAAKRPSFGTTYYTGYNYTRPTSDYTDAFKVYNPDQMYGITSPLTISNYIRNDLAIAGEIAWENGAPAMYLVQINDKTILGQPTAAEIRTAIDVCAEKTEITDVVLIDTELDSAVYLMQHVSDMSSFMEKKYRRGWYGMARDTDVGDSDTPDTYVYRATRTLQPGATSSGRGRQILTAPANISRTMTLEDGREVTRTLDGTFANAAIAGLFTSLASNSDTLMNRTIRGFDISTFGTYLRGERHTLADNGVVVITLDGGQLKLIDPITTEAGGGKLAHFEEISASSQKDAVTRTVDRLLDSNVKGIVPDDPADFITDIASWIILGINASIDNGDCGIYRDDSGSPRAIDPTTDIQVWQSASDGRNYYFRYWFNLLYPAKLFFGEYSVDNPFFRATA